MKTRNDSEFGCVELNPDLNDYYDLETDEEIYVPSNYPFDIPKVYLEGWWNPHDTVEGDCIIMVRDNAVVIYTHYDGYCDKYGVEEYNLDTLEKRTYYVEQGSSSRMDRLDYSRIVHYIDPNLIKKINNNKESSLSNKIHPLDE